MTRATFPTRVRVVDKVAEYRRALFAARRAWVADVARRRGISKRAALRRVRKEGTTLDTRWPLDRSDTRYRGGLVPRSLARARRRLRLQSPGATRYTLADLDHIERYRTVTDRLILFGDPSAPVNPRGVLHA